MAANGQASDITATFGRNLKSARLEAGLTQHQLAVALGRGDGMTVSRWERGEHRPSDEYLAGLARTLKRDVAWFFANHEPEREAA